jgi:hypothetical protein
MNIAIIENNTVVNVIVCDSFELAKELTVAEQVIDSDEHKAYLGYVKTNDIWHPVSLYNSWILNTETRQWDPPISRPNDGNPYIWDETTLSWVVI